MVCCDMAMIKNLSKGCPNHQEVLFMEALSQNSTWFQRLEFINKLEKEYEGWWFFLVI